MAIGPGRVQIPEPARLNAKTLKTDKRLPMEGKGLDMRVALPTRHASMQVQQQSASSHAQYALNHVKKKKKHGNRFSILGLFRIFQVVYCSLCVNVNVKSHLDWVADYLVKQQKQNILCG